MVQNVGDVCTSKTAIHMHLEPTQSTSILLRNKLIEHPMSRSDTAIFRKLNHMHSAPETAYRYPPCSTDRTVLETVCRLKTLDAKGAWCSGRLGASLQGLESSVLTRTTRMGTVRVRKTSACSLQ